MFYKEKIMAEAIHQEVEVEVVEYETEEGEPVKLISHSSLERLLIDFPGIRYEFRSIVADVAHSVVECHMSYEDSRHIISIGESLYKTLKGASKNMPSLMAYNRAFDAAIIKLLGLPPKYFSNLSEISYNEDKFTADEVSAEAIDKAETTTAIAEATENVKKILDPVAKKSEKKVENKEKVKSTASAASAADNTELNTVITFGLAKGKTIHQLLNASDELKHSLSNLVNVVDKISNKEQKEQVLLIKKYLFP